MTVDDLINHFGDVNKAAEFFGITPEAIYQWKRRPNQLIPRGRAAEAQAGTHGVLVYHSDQYKKEKSN